MVNPTAAFDSGSYAGLRARVLRRMRSAKVDDQVLQLLRDAYESALSAEKLVLSRVEKRRLRAELLKAVLEETSRKLEEG